MKRTLNGIEVNVAYYGDKSLDFHFASMEEATIMIDQALKESYTVTIRNNYTYEEDDN